MCATHTGKAARQERKEKDQRGICSSPDQFEKLLGFRLEDLKSFDSLLRLLNRPTDPSGLGVMRIIFGLFFSTFF